ncbi:hypothetical protein GX48_00238 [Paracoccidioides brasiliensis]|nr:hypothetical protein GX48_00238 [Paracoccidioides brasiliensis]
MIERRLMRDRDPLKQVVISSFEGRKQAGVVSLGVEDVGGRQLSKDGPHKASRHDDWGHVLRPIMPRIETRERRKKTEKMKDSQLCTVQHETNNLQEVGSGMIDSGGKWWKREVGDRSAQW